jgi:DNA invertase Pin-like site-specific DNA recombinase
MVAVVSREETVVGYARAGGSLGLEAQRAAIVAECERRGWRLLRLQEDGETGAGGRARALEALERGEAGVLVVAALDRLAASVAAAARLVGRAEREGWNLLALDLGLDLSTAAGRRVAQRFCFVAGWERRLVCERTRAALARRRAQGARLGTPRRASASVVAKIASLRARGLSLQAIAEELNRLRVPTVRGGSSWRPSSVRSVLSRSSS